MYLKSIIFWNSNSTGCPAFLFAKFDNPTSQGHIVIKEWSQNLNPGSVTSEFMLLTTMLLLIIRNAG